MALAPDLDAPAPAPAPSAPRPSRRPTPLAAVLGAAVAFYGLFAWRSSWVTGGRRRFTLVDDAMVSMDYARTLADGHGLVWYPGAPRVEGVTNPLWVAVMAAVHRVGLEGSAAAVAMMLVGAAVLVGCALVSVRVARALGARTPWSDAAAGGLVAFCFPLVFWTLRGMEVGLVTLLTLAAVVLALRVAGAGTADGAAADGRALAGLAAVLTLLVTTRLDGATVVVAVWLWLAWRLRGRARRRALVVVGGVVAAGLALQSAARWWYYGELVPNTYLLKATGAPLGERLARGGWVGTAAVLAGFIAPAVLVTAAHRRRALCHAEGVALLVIVALTTLAYSTYVGGDAWEWMAYPNRYLVVAVVLLAVAAVVAVHDLLAAGSAAAARPLAVAAAVAVVGPFLALVLLDERGLASFRLWALSDHTSRLVLVLTVGVVAVAVARVVTTAMHDGRHVRAAVAVCVALAVGAGLHPYLQWAADGPAHGYVDLRGAEYGELLAEVTDPDARIAIVWAGAPAYYSGRPMIDLLGKNDRHVAEGPTRAGLWVPGHTKWDYGYSIGELRPDLVAQLWRPTDADLASIRAAGYVAAEIIVPAATGRRLESVTAISTPVDHVGPVVLVRRDSAAVDWSRLRVLDEG